MAAAQAPGIAPAGTSRGRDGAFPFLTIALVAALFGSALFSVNNVLLNAALESWHKIQLIQGSFNPVANAQLIYQRASRATALNSQGSALPDIVVDGKIHQYDTRIIRQANQEHRLLPPIFFGANPGQ